MLVLALTLILTALIQTNSEYAISGQVRDSDGKPAAGIAITAYSSESRPNSRTPAGGGAVSDTEGNFTIKISRPGKYMLIYSDRNRVYIPQYQEFFRDPSNPPPEVVLSDSAPHVRADVFMSKNGRLKGTAIDSQTGLPIDNLDFAMCRSDHPGCWRTNAKSARGTFSIPTAFTPFTLRVTSPDYEDWLGLTGNDQRQQIVVSPGTEIELRILMKRRRGTASSAITDDEKIAGLNLPAPKQIEPTENQIFDIFPRRTTLRWEPVEGAASYTVEVDFCQNKPGRNECVNPQTWNSPGNPPTTNIAGTSYEFSFIGAQPGRWRVWAVDKEGRAGFKSAWRTFFYRR